MDKELPSVRSRAYCNLKRSPHYHGIIPDSHYYDHEYGKKRYPIELEQSEYLIGVYENKFGEKIFEIPQDIIIWDTIVITSLALNFCREKKFISKILLK